MRPVVEAYALNEGSKSKECSVFEVACQEQVINNLAKNSWLDHVDTRN